jgi:CTP:phosphocholine cytidylyltransferase-like protein
MRGCRIKITSNKAISEELYDYVITLDKKRVENYGWDHVIEKEHSDIDVTIDKFDTVIIFKTVNLTNARAIELSKD